MLKDEIKEKIANRKHVFPYLALRQEFLRSSNCSLGILYATLAAVLGAGLRVALDLL